MFLVLQWLLRSGLGFWTSIAISVAGTLALLVYRLVRDNEQLTLLIGRIVS